jgi:arginine/lysine/ornithine decarboxylase
MLDQSQAPLLTAAQNYLDVHHVPFYMPGHKRGQGIDPELRDLLGERVFRLDLPEMPDLEAPLEMAQSLAAAAYGVDRTWFLVNGSTCGVEALVLAVCGPGDQILVGRNCHRSLLSGLILAGAEPIYLPTAYDPLWDLELGGQPDVVAGMLSQYPQAKAVFVVSPNYFGVCGDLGTLAEICHSHGVPLLVDGAHGPHLGFHPDLPPSPMQLGADGVVQSTHKVASGMTQASMLHVQGNLIDPERVSQALQLLQSTSPNFLLLLSLDVARRQLVTQGKTALGKTLALAHRARTEINQLEVFRSFSATDIPNLDPTRLTIMTSGLGITGFQADGLMIEQADIVPEMATLSQLVFILSLGNTERDIEKLIDGFATLAHYRSDTPHATLIAPLTLRDHPIQQAMSPRCAYFQPAETVPVKEAMGRVSAEWICPYPPGIPIIALGEIITAPVIDYLVQIREAGGVLRGATDDSLATMRVVREIK